MRVGVTGHRVITDETARLVEADVEHQLDSLHNGSGQELVVYSSLAIGADQIVARAVLARGGSLVFVQPCRNVAATYAADEIGEFKRLRGLAVETVTSDHVEPDGEAFLAAGLEVLSRSDVLLAVWDGLDAVGRGGTGDVVAAAERHGTPYVVIWPEGSARG